MHACQDHAKLHVGFEAAFHGGNGHRISRRFAAVRRQNRDVTLERSSLTSRLLALALVAMWFAGAVPLVVDIDLWHEMAYFREVLERGEFPRHDPFAFTPTVERLIHHEWGFGAVTYALTRAFGGAGIIAFKYLTMALIAILCVRAARRSATPSSLALFAPIAIVLAWPALATVRAHLVTLLGVAILLDMLARDRSGDRRWVIPYLAMQLLWQNLHGGFVAGVGLLAAHAVERALRGEPWRHLALSLAASLALIVCNPYGLHYYGYLLHALTLSREHISEWLPLWHGFSPALLLTLVSLVPIHLALRERPLRKLPGELLVLLAVVQAFAHQRFVSLYALVAFVHVPAWFDGTRFGIRLAELLERRAFAVRYLAAVIGIAMLGHFAMNHPFTLRVPEDPRNPLETGYPVGAVLYLQEIGFRGNLYTHFDAGAYASWKLFPAVRVSFDSRYEVAYRDGQLEENLAFYHAFEGFAAIPARVGADAILIPSNMRVHRRWSEIAGFTPIYRDPFSLLLARRDLALPTRTTAAPHGDGSFP